MQLKDLYRIDENTPNANNKPSFIQAGIQENLELIEIKNEISPTGRLFLAFTFQNSNGDKLTETLWETHFDVPFEQMTSEEQRKKINWINNQMAKLKQIVTPYIGERVIEGGNFEKVAKDIILMLKDSYKGKLVRIKAVYTKNKDGREFVTLPTWADKLFIESMDISKEESKIRHLPGDKFTYTRVEGDKEKQESNPLGVSGTASSDDIPF